jgi:hypothetical protein
VNSPSVPDPPPLPGYRLLRHLGAGGYSQVYLYEQEMPRRNVAVKVLNQSGLTEETRRQFTAEANAMASLAGHPNIVQVFDAALAADGRPYLVMQYYPHPNLSVQARREHFSIADVLRIGIQIGSAVETAHRNGLLHRDIKPHNVLTGQFGAPALTDFGIAARKGADDGGPDGVSVPWSPPEVIYRTSDGDERSDVYSLGATLWHVLVGRSPFEEPGGDNSNLALMGRIQSDPPPPTRRSDVPDSLERLLRQSMAKDPAARPQTALDLVRALQAVEQERRLPLTQIVLAADEPAAQEGIADSDSDATRVRGAERLDPMPGAAPAAPPRRHRQLPADVPATATRARSGVAPSPAAADDTGISVAADRSRSARLIGLAAAVVLVIAAVSIAVAWPHHNSGSTAAGTVKSGRRGESALGPAISAPGTPTVAVTRLSARQVRFRWTYANRAAGDVFRWRRVNDGTGPAVGTTTKPDLLLAVARGKSVCITVQVVRADGSQASTASTPACG